MTAQLPRPVARLDEHAITLLIGNNELRQLLPCLERPKTLLGAAAAPAPGCNTCGGSPRETTSQAISLAKDCVINADAATVAKIKTMLNALTLEIVKHRPDGSQYTYRK